MEAFVVARQALKLVIKLLLLCFKLICNFVMELGCNSPVQTVKVKLTHFCLDSVIRFARLFDVLGEVMLLVFVAAL
ncbi:MAG TPA: hypothetical protein VFB59_03095 [Candidatus Saccharimonadales bacterium]|nr:hypothetical protein [Candidatus Saccharimonadales bacterium]